MKIEIPRQIRVEDFSEDERELISKLSRNLTPFMDSVYRVLDHGVDYENLNRSLIDIDVFTDSAGKIFNPPQIKSTLRGQVKALTVMNAVNLINPNIYPLSAPFINFSSNGSILTILNVTGLQPNSQYRLTVELVA